VAKIVLVCYRNAASAESADAMRRLQWFLASLCPDNLSPVDPVIVTDGGGLLLGVFNPADAATVHACSAYSGWLADGHDSWWRPGACAPSGTYALLRGNPATVEALADFSASRTIWLAHTDQIFIASTSQRAIPYFLGSFEPNPTAQAWMLSAGSLGPSAGWDRRAHPLGPDGVARLDRARWQLAVREPPVEFRIDRSPDRVHAERLHQVLERTIGTATFDYSRWVLPLSGGFDSRAILLMLQQRRGLRTVTWGRAEAIRQRGNDAYVARQVAEAVGVEHQYYETDLSNEPVERLLGRYLTAGDGRTDAFIAYIDGFRAWRLFFESGVRGIIRGEHCFGPGPGPALTDHVQVLLLCSMARWRDYAGTPPLAAFGLPQLDEQPLPQSYAPHDWESPADWRDRLYQLYRVPAYHAGLNDLKAAYVEIAAPLLVREIVALTRTYPDHLRNDKRLFREVVAPLDLPIRFASDSALVTPGQLLDAPAVREVLCDELSSQQLRGALTGQFADYLLNSWPSPAASPRAGFLQRSRSQLRLRVPARLRARLRGKGKAKSLDVRGIALRAYIVSRMLGRLAADARWSADARDS
jgi:Asparagine synthase